MSNFPPRLTALQPFFGSWYLDELLGSGSYGQVFRIRRKEFDRLYYAALKWIPVPADEQEPDRHIQAGSEAASIQAYYRDIVSNLQGEIVLMNTLRGNSNIVSYEDHFIAERSDAIGYDVLIRMELLTPLPALIGKGMAIRDVVKLGLDICDALELCEKASIVHRDIKPDNIFISEFGHYKLGDFGVARQLEHTQDALSRKGTPHYMAPELMLGGTAGREVDLYSLGLVLHNLLNGHRIPFVEVSSRLPTVAEREEAYRRRVRGDKVPPPILGSARLKAAVCKAAAYQPADRYASAAAFRAALLNCRADLEDDTPLNTALLQSEKLKKRAHAPAGEAPPPLDATIPQAVDAPQRSMERKQQPVKHRKAEKAAARGRRSLLVLGALVVFLGLWQLMPRQGQPAPTAEEPSPTVLTEAPQQAAHAVPSQKPPQTSTARPTPMPTTAPTATPPVALAWFPSSGVEARIRKNLGIQADEPLTLEWAAGVEKLDLQNLAISDYGFLTQFSGLTSLHLSYTNNQNLHPLASLTSLEELTVAFSGIKDVTPLAKLTGLTALDLSGNKIMDISPIRYLSSLTSLNISGNRLEDISPLVSCGYLEKLDLQRNKITDISALEGLSKLRELHIEANPIHSYNVNHLPMLEAVDMSGNRRDAVQPGAAGGRLHNLRITQEQATGPVEVSWTNGEHTGQYLLKYQIKGTNPVHPYGQEVLVSELQTQVGPLLPNTNYIFTVENTSDGSTIENDYKTKEAPYFLAPSSRLLNVAFYLSIPSDPGGGISLTKRTSAGFLKTLALRVSPEDLEAGYFFDPNSGFEVMSNGDTSAFERKRGEVKETLILLRLPGGHVFILQESPGYEQVMLFDAPIMALRRIYDHYGRIPTGTWRVELYYNRMLAGTGTLNVQ